MPIATAIAHPNIALCKYWGKRDRALNLPTNPSLSLTLAPFSTRTTVEWGGERDLAVLNGAELSGEGAKKIFRVLDLLDPARPPCVVRSENDFPTGAGLASSSSGFAALVVAGAAAAGQKRPIEELAVLARRGSGSATRSLHGGWVEWPAGTRDDGLDSHGVPIAGPDWWDVRMIVAVIAAGPKDVSSTDGMVRTQATSPYFDAWTKVAAADVPEARAAVLARDLPRLGAIAERSALRMHATTMAADPPFLYWRPATLQALERVRDLRRQGIGAWATMDAGPNVKVLCAAADAPAVAEAVAEVGDRVEILGPGGPARVVP